MVVVAIVAAVAVCLATLVASSNDGHSGSNSLRNDGWEQVEK